MSHNTPNPTNPFIRYALYPLLLIYMLSYAWIEVSGYTTRLGEYRGGYLAILIGVMLIVEILFPLRREWRMTASSFFRRDLPFLVIGAITMFLTQYIGLELILWLGLVRGESHISLPLFVSVALILLITDFCWYWIHRWSHEAKGSVGRFLWQMHAAHHLPGQVYLFMHAVAHPINTVIVRMIYTIPLFFLGFSTEAIFVASLITGLQGLISHYNVDIRAGWVNYVLMGAETHRYHHSASPEEAKNYAATITLWDRIFGTFVYQPDKLPDRLGITNPNLYPADQQIIKVLAMPFSRKDSQRVS